MAASVVHAELRLLLELRSAGWVHAQCRAAILASMYGSETIAMAAERAAEAFRMGDVRNRIDFLQGVIDR